MTYPKIDMRSTLLAALVVAGCTADDTRIGRLPLEPSGALGTIEITPPSMFLGFLGAQGVFRAGLATVDGDSISGVSLAWMSLNPEVATVDGSGVVTAIQEGSARIVVGVLNLADTADVQVLRVPSVVRLTADTALITELGATVQLGATVVDGGGVTLSTAPVTWTSSDTSIVRVSSTGTVTSVGQGVATVTARSDAAGASARIRVSVGPSTLSVTPNSIALTALGDTARVSSTVRDARGDLLESTATYTTVDTTIAVVSADGLITGRKTGTTQLQARADSLLSTVQISVSQVADSVVVTGASGTLIPGATRAFSASAFDSNANPIGSVAFVWTSTDTSVVTVSGTGVATAKGGGTAFVKARVGTASDSVAITVTALPIDSLAAAPDTVTLAVGDSAQVTLRFFVGGTEVTGGTATFSSDSTAIATVNASGLVKGVAEGATWIRAVRDTTAADSVRVTVTAPSTSGSPGGR